MSPWDHITMKELHPTSLRVQVPPNRYLSDLSSSSEGNLGREEESETCSMSKRGRSTRGQKIRRKFHKRMEFFLAEGGVMFLWWWEHRWHRGALEVQTSTETMGTQGTSSNKHRFLCQWEDISHSTIVITWFGPILHGRHKGLLQQSYWIDGVCQTLLQLQRLDATGSIYMKYA